MELKNAVAVCLIALFSATLVLLIARALDLQVASQLKPQLAQIAEELQAIRKGGGFTAASGEGITSRAADDALMAYYFHGVRCPTCRAAESNAYETLESVYASELDSGTVVWKVLDYMTDPTAGTMAENFGVTSSTIVLVRMKGGEISVWNRLDRVLSLAEDKPALSAYLQDEINEMLETPDRESEPAQPGDAPAIPVPVGKTDDQPLSTDPSEIPIPQWEMSSPINQNGGNQ